jgi:ABC-type branched-subunit amino acid transport system ATPase component
MYTEKEVLVEAIKYFNGDELAASVWMKKYALRDSNQYYEKDPTDMHRRLAKELSRKATGDTLYILDEPTTGLHFEDINKLLRVLHKLVDSGNSILVIEHNLDVLKTADWIIDIGPCGGEKGGYIVAQGTPEQVAKDKNSVTGKYLAKSLKNNSK